MFSFLKQALQKIYSQFTSKIQTLFHQTIIDEHSLQELETILIESDTGVATTRMIVETIRKKMKSGEIQQGSDLKKVLEHELITMLKPYTILNPRIYLLIGINGSGKTTFVGKLAYQKVQEGKRVLIAAADTFRAAAPEQLIEWSQRAGADIVIGKPNQDPGAVVFSACQKFVAEQYDVLIIDTAGRLQTKINLMKELEKLKRIIERQFPHETICTLLTVDAMLGQNSFEQAQLFNESTTINGIILTKIDGTGKGGIVFSINQKLSIPVAYLSYGEQIQQVKNFSPQEYVQQLLHE